MKRISGYLWPAAVLALPLVLLLSSLLTLHEFEDLREVYLRNRAAAIAGRLETFVPGDLQQQLDSIAENEPGLVDLNLLERSEADANTPVLNPIWRGEALFHTQILPAEGGNVFRAYIPFHLDNRLRIARIDLAVSSSDYLIAPARRNVLVASVSGMALLTLALYSLWSKRRRIGLERRQLELEHLAHIGTLASVLAHEIRNPLGTIKGFAQLASERADAATGALVSPIVAETERLEKLVSDLLAYGKNPEPSPRPAAWAPLAAELDACARGCGFPNFSCAATPIRFTTDPEMLRQILLNLVRNAVDAAGKDGHVSVTAGQRAGGGLRVEVRDDGPGIPEPVRARLFEPFFTTKASGAGLGLSIARKLAIALGGRIEILAGEPRGTIVELTFPDMKTEAAEAEWQKS